MGCAFSCVCCYRFFVGVFLFDLIVYISFGWVLVEPCTLFGW